MDYREKQKRPPRFYVKLESETTYAITWRTGKDKVAKLFKTDLDRFEWERSDECKEIKANGYTLRHEDRYISKVKSGLIIERGGNLVYDVYILGYNKCELYEKTVISERAHQVNVEARKAIAMHNERLNEQIKKLEEDNDNLEQLKFEYLKLCREWDATYQRALAKRYK